MKSNKMMIAAVAMSGFGASMAAKVLEADAEARRYGMDADKRKAEDAAPRAVKPSGSKPVSGGGARERSRRLARMSCDECGEHIGHCECHVTPE